MIKTWLITGDTHSKVFDRLNSNPYDCVPEETALIILGDAGLNFYLNRTDERNKRKIAETGYHVYCVRGNHEERPENLGYEVAYDKDVCGEVYVDPINHNICYFIDGGEYTIGEFSVLVIGGAYSVDKHYRLARAAAAGKSFTGWFEDEQLTSEEREAIDRKVADRKYDFVLTHTCPIDWQPTDLFLSAVNQSTVDTSMEIWLQRLKDEIDWGVWVFGHFHDNRLVRPGVEMMYTDITSVQEIWDRWNNDDEYEQSTWYYKKDPNYYMGR